jgi:hypothetical protein
MVMNMPIKISAASIDWSGCHHWHDALPYRAIVPVRRHGTDGPLLYQVAGSDAPPCGADKAIRSAATIHGGHCFYCKHPLKIGDFKNGWTIDHVEPSALGGSSHLENLVVSCQPCNSKKGHEPIDSFNPQACEEWLLALAKQIDHRFERLKGSKIS